MTAVLTARLGRVFLGDHQLFKIDDTAMRSVRSRYAVRVVKFMQHRKLDSSAVMEAGCYLAHLARGKAGDTPPIRCLHTVVSCCRSLAESQLRA